MDDDYTVINSLVAGGPAAKSKSIASAIVSSASARPVKAWLMSSAGVWMTLSR
jgi:C-terminal processing protease CtpA/Prc